MRTIRLLCALALASTACTACTACSTPAADNTSCTPGFTCTTLHVPLDRQRPDGPSLDLAVIAADNVDASRGVLLLLTGGPGQPGVPLLPGLRRNVHPDVLREYRLVMFDQRGTGPDGINCPSLQETVGGSDFLTPPATAVDECAAHIGSGVGYYGTPDTVDDIEQLRQYLKVDRLTLDGTSYGSFTAVQYGLKYPDKVQALVLDSVVPHKGFDPMGVDLMGASAGVLEAACGQDPACTTDPVADLAWLVQHGVSGTDLMETLSVTSLNSVNPSLSGIPAILHSARGGDDRGLKELFQRTTSKGLTYDTPLRRPPHGDALLGPPPAREQRPVLPARLGQVGGRARTRRRAGRRTGKRSQRAARPPWAADGPGVPASLEIELCANGCSTWAAGCV
ncbi:alpha/beta fold hydrolase [Kribbella sp. NPDC055110]